MGVEAIICMDIGGTNLRMGMVDRAYCLTDVQILSTKEVSKQGFASGLISVLQNYRAQIKTQFEIVAVSLGVPAAVDKQRKVVLQAPNIPGLDGLPIVEQIEEAMNLPVFLAKDVDLLLTYDLFRENLPEDSLTVGIYFGTGIGNSIFLDGKILTGKNGVAGELGHIPQLLSDKQCGCGNIGCLEALGGGRQLSYLCETVFPDTHVSKIYRYHSNTPQVQQQLEAMAVAVATEVNILDPDYVIIGGGLPQMDGFPREYFLKRIWARCRKPSPMENLDIRFARSNQENGILGAGIYGWRRMQQNSAKKECRAAR